MKIRTLPGLATLALLAVGGVAQAQTEMTGTITVVRTGWNSDAFAIQTVEKTADPAHCGRQDGAISTKSDPGYDTFLAAALTAYSVRRKVVLIIHNSACVSGWPKLIGVNLLKD